MSKKIKKDKASKKVKGLWAEFKAFIARGNVLDMAIGVVIGGAFGAIVTAVVNVLLSVCTWGVPGGLAGLITVLPAINPAQQGIAGIGQSFNINDLTQATITFAETQGLTGLTVADPTFVQWQTALLGKYTLYGTTYVWNGSALINWGAVINAIISFLIIAIVLFVILKVVTAIKKKSEEAMKKIKDKIEAAHKKNNEESEEESEEESSEEPAEENAAE